MNNYLAVLAMLTTITGMVGVANAHIIRGIDTQNGLTYTYLDTNDTTGLGVRSNWDYSCTVFFPIGNFYWQTNSFSC